MLAVLCCAAGLGAVAHLRTSHYHYDVSSDAAYDFSRSSVSRLPAMLRHSTLTVPARTDPADTVLLAVRVQASWLGRWFEPHIDVQSGQQHLRQAFALGASGLRYINLSPLQLDRAAPIRLNGTRLKVGDQTAQLYYLHSDVDFAHPRILVLSPHPDDAEIAAFGLYSGSDAYVVTVTAGEGGGSAGAFGRFGHDDAYLLKGRTRVWNSLVVPLLGGLSSERTANLGYFDGTLQAMQARPDQAVRSITTGAASLDVFRRTYATDLVLAQPGRRATMSNLVEDLKYVLQRVRPDIIVAPYPRLDAHPDHKVSTVALIDALKGLDWRSGTLLLYTNHLPASGLYPYGSSGDVVSLPPGTPGIVFDGIVSRSLSAAEQARKLIALDEMNDLRRDIGLPSLPGAGRAFLGLLRSAIENHRVDYYRRAVRANELFFEIRVASLYQPGIVGRIEGAP
jgi:hypothetical protein